ncbi:MAG: TetR/AcrR family transcriptional regulator [Candidatus Heimdallarchaeota archaeon]
MSTRKIRLKNDQRRESIISSTIDIMARKGIESISMNDIAQADGISKTLLYKYFKNKYQILCAIADTRLNTVIQLIDELLATIKVMLPDLEVTIPLIWKLLKTRLEDNRSLIILFFRERVNIPQYLQKMVEFSNLPKGENYITKILKTIGNVRIFEILTEYFQRCKDAGNLTENLTALDCTRLFTSLVWTPINLFPMENTENIITPDVELENLVNIQIKALLFGLIPRK